MGYLIFFIVIAIIVLLSYVAIRWAIHDMTKLSDSEVQKLTTGDMIRTKTEDKEIVTGRIALICHDEGWGVLKEAKPPHQAHSFEVRDIREKL
jgi:hypothetical protein